MKKSLCLTLLFVVFTGRAYAQQTNTFPASGNVGIGILSPGANLHIRSANPSISTWVSLDKHPNTEGGFHFKKSNAVLFYFYSDNADNDALKIQSTGVPGEGDATPRIQIPFSSPDLYLTQSGGNVGIGTNAPIHKLHVAGGAIGLDADQPLRGGGKYLISGNATEVTLGTANPGVGLRVNAGDVDRIYINGTTGNVGIGKGAPAHKLDVNGTVKAAALSIDGHTGIGTVSQFADARLHVKAPTSSPWGIVAEASANQKIIGISHNGTAGFISTGSVGSDGASPIHFQTSGAVRMSILEAGNVSIGTPLASNPNNYLLAVNGKIGAKEVRVEKTSAAWPDYVFDPGYKLPDLKAVEAFIAANKHLHDVPSAKEVESKGHDLGAMDAVLLKKIEELTLYVIELNKDLQEEKRLNEKQRSEIDTLKKQCPGRE